MQHRSSFALALLVLGVAFGAGCNSDDGSGCIAGAFMVSLDGSVACGDLTCTSGQLCKPWPLVDGSVNANECVDVPRGCPVCLCVDDACPECVAELCGMPPGSSGGLARVEGRMLHCPHVQ